MMREHGKDIRYIQAWKKWLVWNGRQWVSDDGCLIHERGLKMIHGIYDELLTTRDYRDQMEIEKYAMQAEAVRRRKAFIEAASWIPDLNLHTGDVDKDPWLFNVKNGTVDLRAGEFREQRREDFITKMANVDFDENAECPTWRQFIREIMGCNASLVYFLQCAAGMVLTGDTSEQTMFILFGSGANGKSTFLNTLMKVLGDYSIATPTETFMKKTGEQISNDIARLRGMRLVTTTEAEQGKRLSEPLIKQITGNDALTARFLYGEFFDFVPTFKVFMATNHKPMIKGTDYGIWRRIKLIPFLTTITPDRQDKHLEEKLLAERSGILNWLIEGAREWQAKGLIAPKEVSLATEEYRSEMDVLGNFIKECCVQLPGVQIRVRELFKAYQDWCEDNNEKAFSERYFSLRLKELGVERTRTSEARFWKGIALKADASG
jgi:putative DNA primase/helicase